MKTWETLNGYRITKLLAGRSNVFLITHSNTKILVDTSTSWNWNRLDKRLRMLNIEHLDFLVLTHTHFDHAGNAKRIKEEFNPKVIVHQSEANILRSGISIIPKGTNWFTQFLVNPLGRKFAPKTNFNGCEPDIVVSSVYCFDNFGLNLYLLHTPGHSDGSISLIVDNEIALVGDTMFGILPASIFPPFADNIHELIFSWGKLLETNCHTFLPSHGSANSRLLAVKNFTRLRLGLNVK